MSSSTVLCLAIQTQRFLPWKAPTPDWQAWLVCCAVVDAGGDPTGGANCYRYSEPIEHVPSWATPDKFTVQIGAFRVL